MIAINLNILFSAMADSGGQTVVRLRTMSAAVAFLPVIINELVKPSTMTFCLWGAEHCQVIIIGNC